MVDCVGDKHNINTTSGCPGEKVRALISGPVGPYQSIIFLYILYVSRADDFLTVP